MRLRSSRQAVKETCDLEELLDVAAGIGNMKATAHSFREVEEPNQFADAGGVDVGQLRQVQQNSALTTNERRLDLLAQFRIHRCLEFSTDSNGPRRGGLESPACRLALAVTRAAIVRGPRPYFLDDRSSCGAGDQPAALPVRFGEELFTRRVNGRDPHQVERHSAMRLFARRCRPASCQFSDPRAGEPTVKSKGDRRGVRVNGNHEHIRASIYLVERRYPKSTRW